MTGLLGPSVAYQAIGGPFFMPKTFFADPEKKLEKGLTFGAVWAMM